MLLLILAGLVYAIWADSLPVSIIVAAMILYRAQRPSKFLPRLRDAWYMRQAAQVGEDE